ncbi:MAG: hypothetical protein A3C84_01700 [Candidatus Ryanbacteria bacterium RIFCSPHIGHO2_02_FULL_48_12]|nr:MAG: hypothetical protein A3C84_01700 [Candidatus Ryanbacteria bacterium RIFCSPHIGHO2_02_FULL_48_12]
MDTLSGLNERQKEAVLATEGPLLLVAGAGSGKTKVLVHRIAHLIAKGIEPEKILAVTFTNKAAREMQERVSAFLDAHGGQTVPAWRRPWIGTFHALGVQMLRADGEAIGIPRTFSILDEDDSVSIVKTIVKTMELDAKQFQPSRIRHIISKLKNDFIDPESYEIAGDEGIYPGIIKKIYQAYETELTRAHGLDFDDLLVKTVRLLTKDKLAFEKYQQKWRYMMVDEYQDTNSVQYTLTKLLASGHGNITVVGDADQAIYSWRGADFRNILNFEHDWPNARVITLEQNYRSTKTILEAANIVIQKNIERKEKNLWTDNSAGDLLRIFVSEDEKREASAVVHQIARAQRVGTPLHDMAILYRTNAQSRAMEEALIKRGIPYRLLGGVRFYDRKEIRDVLAYVRLAVNPDDFISLKRIINTPTRGIGKTVADKYAANTPPLNEKELAKIAPFQRVMETIRMSLAKDQTTELIRGILTITGYESYMRDGTPEGEDRWANVQELFTVTQGYDALEAPAGTQKFLEDVALISDADLVDTTQEAVHMMTVHAAKGLEFRLVFIIGLEEGIFPHSLSLGDPKGLEEERRLCYVALARAKEHLYLSFARTRSLYGEKMWNEPSRFLRDIPAHLLAEPVDLDLDEYILYETE